MPSSRSRVASCWDTAGGVRWRDRAASAMLPAAANARKTSSRRGSIIRKNSFAARNRTLLYLMILPGEDRCVRTAGHAGGKHQADNRLGGGPGRRARRDAL